MVSTLEPINFSVVSGRDAVVLMVNERVRWINDEWYLSPGIGVDYREIQGGANRENDAVLELLTNIREVTGVTGASSLGHRYTSDRRLSIEILVETEDGSFRTEAIV